MATFKKYKPLFFCLEIWQKFLLLDHIDHELSFLDKGFVLNRRQAIFKPMLIQ